MRGEWWSVHTVAMLRFVCGFALFGAGLLLTYRAEHGRYGAKLAIGFLLTLCGSVILLAFPWPR